MADCCVLWASIECGGEGGEGSDHACDHRCNKNVQCLFFRILEFLFSQSYANDTLAGNSRRKLARVIRRWKLANVTCFPVLVFSSCENLARYSAMLYSTLESGVGNEMRDSSQGCIHISRFFYGYENLLKQQLVHKQQQQHLRRLPCFLVGN